MKTDFDYTMLSTFMSCQRRYNFRMNKGLVGKASMPAPEFGKAMHKALDQWYKTKDVNDAIEVFKANFTEDPDDDKRTYKMASWILRNYDEKYKDQPFKVLATEQEFTLPLPNGNNLIGRIDKIIEWDGQVWGMDHKTTSQLGDTYMRFHTPNLQFSGYSWAITKLGFPECRGILVDALLVAKGLLEGKSKTLVPLRRDFAYRNAADIEEYLETVSCIQNRIHLNEIEDDPAFSWTPNWDACTDYGECPYRKICKEPAEFRQRIIDSEFKVEPWDPRAKEKE